MAIDGKLLAGAKHKLAEKRMARAFEFERREAEVYARARHIEKIDAQIRENMPRLVGIAIGAEPGTSTDDILAETERLYAKRREELKKAGFREDYLDEGYMCDACKDTGFTETKMCVCLRNLYMEEQNASLSSLLKLGGETFENFKLDYYDSKPAADSVFSPRQAMEIIFETCKSYADKFNEKSMNLFFVGAPGLGKTFLSACIARVVADKGFSVVYDTAITIFNTYENIQFSKTDDLDETRSEINRYLECDLLIIDDLGTEMTNTPSVEAFYEIVNTRLVNNRKTIVSSNMSIEEMRMRYPEYIMSRLEWEYKVLVFHGEDIRKKKSEEK